MQKLKLAFALTFFCILFPRCVLANDFSTIPLNVGCVVCDAGLEVKQESMIEDTVTIIESKDDLIVLTDEEIDLLYLVVSAEAKNQDFFVQKMIAECILNRIESDLFPDTLSEVIYQKENGVLQFSSVPVLHNERPSELTIQACNQALLERDLDSEVVFFNSIGYFDFAEDYCKAGDFYFSKAKGDAYE